MRRTILMLLVLCMWTVSQALDVDISIPEKIDGYRSFLQADRVLEGKPQRFLLTWENQGSVACKTRMRVDIYNKSSILYTAWSPETALQPGDYAALEAYYYPLYSGNYSANLSIYYCNMIKDAGSVDFYADAKENYETLTGQGPERNETRRIRTEAYLNQTPINITAENTKDMLIIRVRSDEALGDLVIIPRKYPAGWIFESGRIMDIAPGAEKTVEIGFEPSVFRPADIDFDVATSDGSIHAFHRIRLKEAEEKPAGLEQYLVPGLIAAVIILATLLVLEKRKR